MVVPDGDDAGLEAWWVALSGSGVDALAGVEVRSALSVDPGGAAAGTTLRLDPDEPWRLPPVLGYAILLGSLIDASLETPFDGSQPQAGSLGDRCRALAVRAGIATDMDAEALEALWIDTVAESRRSDDTTDPQVVRQHLRRLLASTSPSRDGPPRDSASHRPPDVVPSPIQGRLAARWLRRSLRPLSEALHRRAIRASGLFDERWYRQRYPDVEAAGMDALDHYVRHGWREGRHPGPRFDSSAYLRRHADVARGGGDPLLHYLRHGRREGRSAAPDHPSNDAADRS
jgi:hypothetical protein